MSTMKDVEDGIRELASQLYPGINSETKVLWVTKSKARIGEGDDKEDIDLISVVGDYTANYVIGYGPNHNVIAARRRDSKWIRTEDSGYHRLSKEGDEIQGK